MNIKISYKEIGNRLREARKNQRMTQREVGERLGMEPDSYGNIERGSESPSLSRIIELCIILKLKPGQLLDDCCPELIMQDNDADKSPIYSRKTLNEFLANCSSDLVETLYEIAIVLNNRNL